MGAPSLSPYYGHYTVEKMLCGVKDLKNSRRRVCVLTDFHADGPREEIKLTVRPFQNLHKWFYSGDSLHVLDAWKQIEGYLFFPHVLQRGFNHNVHGSWFMGFSFSFFVSLGVHEAFSQEDFPTYTWVGKLDSTHLYTSPTIQWLASCHIFWASFTFLHNSSSHWWALIWTCSCLDYIPWFQISKITGNAWWKSLSTQPLLLEFFSYLLLFY